MPHFTPMTGIAATPSRMIAIDPATQIFHLPMKS
jgi:hypothetical protein